MRGVVTRPMYPYVGNHLIRVRRDERVAREESWEIAVAALRQNRNRYAFARIAKLYFQCLRGLHEPRDGQPRRSPQVVYCSELYADAYSTVTGRVLHNTVNGEVTPAFLSQTPLLRDVVVEWMVIGGNRAD